jgi:hypothetical protein
MPHHSVWQWTWRTGPNLATTYEQVLHYEDDFMKPPEIVSCEGAELRIRLFGKKSSKFWRDWLVSRLLPDLKAEFPEVEVGKGLCIEDCRE